MSAKTLKQQLDDEVRMLRQEAECLPPGELRYAVEETAQYAEKLLGDLRNYGAIEWPAFLQKRFRFEAVDAVKSIRPRPAPHLIRRLPK